MIEKIVLFDLCWKPDTLSNGAIGIILNKHEENELSIEEQYTFKVIGPTYDILFYCRVYTLTWVKVLRNSKPEVWENVYFLDSDYNTDDYNPYDNSHIIPYGFVNFI